MIRGMGVFVSLALVACGTSQGGGGDDGGGDDGPGDDGPGPGWHPIKLPDGQANNSVMGVHCTSAAACVIATSNAGNGADAGGVFALKSGVVGAAALVDGGSQELQDVAEVVVIGGGLDFVGLQPVGGRLMARMDVSGAFVSAPLTDVTAGWTFVSMGRSGGDALGLNSQNVLQSDPSGQSWIFINKLGAVFHATMAPGSGTAWTEIWSPLATPSVPADFEDQLAASMAADPMHPLCDSDVSAGGLPSPANPNWVAPDLGLILLPAGGLNQNGDAAPGVCISTDHGEHFYSVALAGLPMDVSSPGPHDVMCLDRDRCFAFSGLPFQMGTAYIYSTANASANGGKGSTWTAATVPASWATSETVELHAMFFAPDGMHGWVVGNTDHKPLLVRTTDGGAHWTDVSGSLGTAASADLYGGFALDADHVWLTGRFGTLVATSTAQK